MPSYEMWRCSTGTLVRLGHPRDWIRNTVRLHPDPKSEVVREPGNFSFVDASGKVTRHWESSMYLFEEDANATAYLVEDGKFLELDLLQHRGRVERFDQTVVLSGLTPVAPTDKAEEQRVARAFGVLQAAQAREEQKRQTVGDARIALIPYALDTFRLGPDFERAREVLCDAIRKWPETLDEQLLGALLELALLHKKADAAAARALEWAIAPFVSACRTVKYDRSLDKAAVVLGAAPPQGVGPNDVPKELHSKLAPVMEQLHALEALLKQHSGWASDNDAHGEAGALHSAAVRTEEARRRLATLLDAT